VGGPGCSIKGNLFMGGLAKGVNAIPLDVISQRLPVETGLDTKGDWDRQVTC
jgi:hypothetical protein